MAISEGTAISLELDQLRALGRSGRAAALSALRRRAALGRAMHKPKPYKCSICGSEVPDLPMPVLKHQLSHIRRRPFNRSRLVDVETVDGPDDPVSDVGGHPPPIRSLD